MGKRIISEFYCDICGTVMPNSKLVTTTTITIESPIGYLDLVTVVKCHDQVKKDTGKSLAICTTCVRNCMQTSANMMEI